LVVIEEGVVGFGVDWEDGKDGNGAARGGAGIGLAASVGFGAAAEGEGADAVAWAAGAAAALILKPSLRAFSKAERVFSVIYRPALMVTATLLFLRGLSTVRGAW
jgi:hypothetical protein